MAILATNTSELSVCLVNCQSLVAHLDEFRLYFAANFYHLICLTETWLSNLVDSSYVSLPGYSLVRCDRTGKRGGGVGVYVHHSLQVKTLSSSSCIYDHRPEFLFLEIICAHAAKLLLGVIYRPPKTGFWDGFENEIVNLSTTYKHCIFMGDFNTDLLTSSFDRQHLLDFINSQSLYLVPFNATHHTISSHTILDLCVVDDADKIASSYQEPVPFLSAHDLISISYKLHVRNLTTASISCRDFRNFDKSSFLHDLGTVDWSPFFNSSFVDEKVKFLNDTLVNIFDRYAPLRMQSKRSQPASWLSDHIRSEIRRRNRLRKKFQRSNSPDHWIAFKKARNLVKRLIRDSKRSFFEGYFSKFHSSAEVWTKLRQLRLIKSKADPSPLRVDVDELNEWFTSSSSITAADSIPVIPGKGYDDKYFYFSDVSPEMLLDALRCLRSNAKGVDGLTASMIRISLPIIFPVLLHLYNFSLNDAYFPTLWKSALVRPIPKCKFPASPADYRPISILCSLSKPLEKIVASQLTSYLETHNLLDPFQSAYRCNYSTQTALIRIVDDIRYAVDQRKVTIMVLFDFSKAFDKVVFSTLINKLDRLNVSSAALTWFSSYITNHRQAVLGDDNNISLWAPLTAGVPQGSILGPLLFAIYVSDLRAVIDCKYSFYADDLQIYQHCTIDNVNETIAHLNVCISHICEWAVVNGLTLNSAKTKAIIFGSERYVCALERTTLPPITVLSTNVDYCDHVTLLGVTLSSTLKWRDHALQVVSKINRQLYLLKLNRELFSFNLRRKLISTLIFPHIDYCCVVLTNISAEDNSLLQRALNGGVRFVTGLRKWDHVTPSYLRLCWLKVSQRRLYFALILIYKLLRIKRPGYLYDRLSLDSRPATYSFRSDPNQLTIAHSRTSTWQLSFTIAASQSWNVLPFNLRMDDAIQSFKVALYRHLLGQL